MTDFFRTMNLSPSVQANPIVDVSVSLHHHGNDLTWILTLTAWDRRSYPLTWGVNARTTPSLTDEAFINPPPSPP